MKLCLFSINIAISRNFCSVPRAFWLVLGSDPATDLRGVGILGLIHLLSLLTDNSTKHLATDVYKLSLHETQVVYLIRNTKCAASLQKSLDVCWNESGIIPDWSKKYCFNLNLSIFCLLIIMPINIVLGVSKTTLRWY